ncbi:MAG: 3-hydroxyacyl-CoA dehydrogenase family protein [Thermodesulfobacteriota bacterium]
MEIKKIGVVGCGLMGSGISQVCAQSGYGVTVLEADEGLLLKGLDSIRRFLDKGVEKGKLSKEARDATMGRIRGTTELRDLSESDLVIEAVPERMDLKKKIFVDLDKICPAHAILATNTSALSVIEMGTATHRPDKVAGMHFFNPVPIMHLVEVIRSLATSEETIELVKAFGKSLGKTIVVARDTPGFIVNRLSIAFTINAIRMLESGIATREDIDTSATQGLNHPMGPLALADFLGVDTLYYAASDMYEKTRDPIFAPPVLLQKMISAGWFGRKAGRGFYEY